MFAKIKNAIFNGIKNRKTQDESEFSTFSVLTSLSSRTLKIPIVFCGSIFFVILIVFILILCIPEYLYAATNEGDSSDSNGSTNGNYSGDIGYVQWAVDIANDDSHGYSQCNRNGPDYDCSSLVWYSLLNTGYSQAELGGYAFTTYGMESVLTSIGFERYAYVESELQPGDILWRSSHTGIYVGNGQVVQASSSREGNGLCGRTGDQDGTEVWVSQNVGNWTAYFRKVS